MAKSLTYCIKANGKYLHGIKPNAEYSLTATAPTMGARHSYSEYETVWGDDPKGIEPLTLANYIKVLCEENRWETRHVKKFEVSVFSEENK